MTTKTIMAFIKALITQRDWRPSARATCWTSRGMKDKRDWGFKQALSNE
jgi:hypothetical protein